MINFQKPNDKGNPNVKLVVVIRDKILEKFSANTYLLISILLIERIKLC